MFVKVCGITSEEDALLAIAMGADALGFVLAPSPRQIRAEKVRDIIKRLPPEVVTVGVFKDESPAKVAETVNKIGLKGAQLEGHESPKQLSWIRERVPFTIRALPPAASSASAQKLARAGTNDTDVMLINAVPGDATQVFDWRLAEVPKTQRLMLGGDFTEANISSAISQVHPWGIDLSSGGESSPGHKDARKLRLLIDAARAAEPSRYRSDGEDRPYDWQEEV